MGVYMIPSVMPSMDSTNLNSLEIRVEIKDTQAQDNNNSKNRDIEVYFRDLAGHLVSKIEEADAVMGCTAWLTHRDVLAALASLKHGASIVVQKEDFLRPDVAPYCAQGLREQYLKIKPLRFTPSLYLGGDFVETHTLASKLSTHGWPDDEMTAVRCAGNHNANRVAAMPRMHNKFFIFGRVVPDMDWDWFFPYAVWTGSFNPTFNGGRSLENAVYISNPVIVQQYMKEWAQIVAISEPLDWKTEWACPTLRIGS
jgi:hypothetical protein